MVIMLVAISSIIFLFTSITYKDDIITDKGILTQPTDYTFKIDGHTYYYEYYECNTPIQHFNNSCVEIKYFSGCGQTIIHNIECICRCECD